MVLLSEPSSVSVDEFFSTGGSTDLFGFLYGSFHPYRFHEYGGEGDLRLYGREALLWKVARYFRSLTNRDWSSIQLRMPLGYNYTTQYSNFDQSKLNP